VSDWEWLEGILKDYPHFKTGNGVLILGDSREVLKRFPSGVVDHVITDPPWGVGFDEYDDLGVFLDVRDELHRIMKPDSWLVFYFATKRVFDLAPLLERFTYKWLIPCLFPSETWTPLGFKSSFSLILVFAKGKPKVVHKRRDVIYPEELPIVEGNTRERQFKPTIATAILLNVFTKPGDLILDPFSGYGSIPLVAELFGRKWVGIEIDPERFEIAKRIISEKRVVDIKKMREEIKAGAGKGKGLFGVSL
jgi:tRNA G10  N-methylase Trm11